MLQLPTLPVVESTCCFFLPFYMLQTDAGIVHYCWPCIGRRTLEFAYGLEPGVSRDVECSIMFAKHAAAMTQFQQTQEHDL